MEETKKALRAAVDAVTSIQVQTIDVENIHANAAEIFGNAEEKIKLCFDHYQVLSSFFCPPRFTDSSHSSLLRGMAMQIK